MKIGDVIISNGKAIGVLCRNAWGEVNPFVGTVVHFNGNPQQTLGGGLICIRQPQGLDEKKTTICFCRNDVVELVEFWSVEARNNWLRERKAE